MAELVGAVAALMEDETPTVARRALQCAAFILSDLLRTLYVQRVLVDTLLVAGCSHKLDTFVESVLSCHHHK